MHATMHADHCMPTIVFKTTIHQSEGAKPCSDVGQCGHRHERPCMIPPRSFPRFFGCCNASHVQDPSSTAQNSMVIRSRNREQLLHSARGAAPWSGSTNINNGLFPRRCYPRDVPFPPPVAFQQHRQTDYYPPCYLRDICLILQNAPE